MLPVSPVSTDFYGNIRSLNFDSFRAYSKGRFRNLHFIQLDPIHKSQLLVIALWNPQTIIVIIMCILWQGVFNRSNGCTSMSRDIGNGESGEKEKRKKPMAMTGVKMKRLWTLSSSTDRYWKFSNLVRPLSRWVCILQLLVQFTKHFKWTAQICCKIVCM